MMRLEVGGQEIAGCTLAALDRVFSPGGVLSHFVFDFDGVIASQIEERVYRLPETPGERERLAAIAPKYQIDPVAFDTRYLRHLLLQEIFRAQRVPVSAGPLAHAAAELTKVGRSFFIVTARSGPAAVSRALAFLEEQEIKPQEIFCVGRAPKGRQLSLVRKTVTDGPIVYFDDSDRHMRNSKQQAISDLVPVHVTWPEPQCFAEAQNLYETSLGWAERTRSKRERHAA